MYGKQSIGQLSELPRKDRLLVLYAHAANSDTWRGGCYAMMRAARSKLAEALDVVRQVYSRSSGKVPLELECCACGECGQAYYGIDAANECCAEIFEEDELLPLE